MIDNLNHIEKKTLMYIRNNIIHGNRNPSIRGVMKYLGYNSPRSASLIVSSLINKGFIKRSDSNKEIVLLKGLDSENKNIPLIGNIFYGDSMFAVENIEAYIPYPVKENANKYFFIRAVGDSMNLIGINDGDLVLVKRQKVVNSGDKVVVLIGNELNIKVYKRRKDKIVLESKSSNPIHKPIYIFRDIEIEGKVVEIINKNKRF